MHNMGFGYTCFASAFAFFISDTEVKTQSSQVLKAFEDIKTEEQFKSLNLPIYNTIDATDGAVVNKAFEIDISSFKKIERALKITKLDCIPVLFVISNPVLKDWTVQFH